MSDKVTFIETPVKLQYQVVPGDRRRKFLFSVEKKILFGTRCPITGKVYFPPRRSSPATGALMTEEVPVKDTGIVTSFCIVRMKFEGQLLEAPYACAHVVLDGANSMIPHLVGGCDVDLIHMGMRVRAVWRPDVECSPSMENILYFEPSGEEDAPFESYKEHL